MPFKCNSCRYHEVYISSDHEKSRFGEGSPGPASLGPAAFVGLGKQVSSQKTSLPKYSFGTSVRGALTNNTNPGPGAYD